MLKFLSSMQGGGRAEIKDARQIYQKNMEQSRNPAFYGPNLFADSYDGRMEVLCMHLSIILHALRRFDENGQRLSQALYDVMIEDFDIALREEGLSDTGVARRIKPLAKMFFARAKSYAEILQASEDKQGALGEILESYISLSHGIDYSSDNINHGKIAKYAENFSHTVMKNSLGEMAQTKFSFPDLS